MLQQHVVPETVPMEYGDGIPADHANPSEATPFIPHFWDASPKGQDGESLDGNKWWRHVRALRQKKWCYVVRQEKLTDPRDWDAVQMDQQSFATSRKPSRTSHWTPMRRAVAATHQPGNSGAMRCSEHPQSHVRLVLAWAWHCSPRWPTIQFSRPLYGDPTNLWYPTSAGLFPQGYMAEHPTESEGLRGT